MNLLERIHEVADAARDARTATTGLNAIKAGDAELRALTALTNRFGIDSSTVLENLSEGRALAAAVGSVARQFPRVGEAIATELAAAGHADFAEAIRDLNPTDSPKEIQ